MAVAMLHTSSQPRVLICNTRGLDQLTANVPFQAVVFKVATVEFPDQCFMGLPLSRTL